MLLEEINLYLKKISLENEISTSQFDLNKLQKNHLLNIPFENLDIHNGVPIILSVESFIDKIIYRNRGGFCYELNGLFIELLKFLGYKAFLISGRVFDKEKMYGYEYDHMAILVEIDGEEYLSDVGFGEFAMKPLKIIPDLEQEDERGFFKIDNYDSKYLRVSKKAKEHWVPQYLFTRERRDLEDFQSMCNYHQTSPDSHFTKKRLISKATERGRITISGDALLIKENGGESNTALMDEDHFQEMYQKYFM